MSGSHTSCSTNTGKRTFRTWSTISSRVTSSRQAATAAGTTTRWRIRSSAENPLQKESQPECEDLRRNVVLLHVMAERAVRHAEELSCFDLNSAGSAKRLFQESFLKVFDVGFEIESFIRKVRNPAHAMIGGDALRQMLGGELGRGLQNKRSLQCIFELAHVAGPVVSFQLLESLVRDTVDLFAHRCIQSGQEVVGQ